MCEPFVENPRPLNEPYRAHSRASEAHFRVLLAAIEGVTMEIEMENPLDLESLITEFQFMEFGQHVTEFVSTILTSRLSGLGRR
jgi:hypothetical protein